MIRKWGVETLQCVLIMLVVMSSLCILNGQEVADKTEDDVATIYAKGIEAYKAKKYEEALVYYEKVISNADDPDLLCRAYFSKACVLRDLKHYNKAIETYRQVIDKFPEHQRARRAFRNIARIYDLHLNDNAKALKYYKEYVKKYPEEARDLKLTIQGIYAEMEQSDSLIASYQKEIGKDPTSKMGIFYKTQLADLYFQKGEYKKALEIYEKIAKEYSDQEKVASGALKQMANYYMLFAKDDKKAYEYLDRLIKEYPHSHWAKTMKEDYEDLKKKIARKEKGKEEAVIEPSLNKKLITTIVIILVIVVIAIVVLIKKQK